MSEAPISVAALLDEHVAALEEERLPDGKWHPSSYWGCDRKVIYEVRGTEKTNPPDKVSKRRFRIGHILHEFIQGALLTAPDLDAFYPEFLIESKLEETGHGDGLAKVAGQDLWFVLEFKSINSNGFRFLKTEAKDDHAKQGSSYAIRARNDGVWVDGPDDQVFVPALGDKLAGVLVVYFDKDTLQVKEFWLPYDVAWETRVEERIAHLETYRQDPESLPPRMPDRNKFPCSWKGGSCDFFDRCWNQDGPGVEPVGKTDVPEVFEW